MTGAFHRVGQFWRHASATVNGDERLQAGAILGSRLAPVFFELPVNDQRHGLDVLQTVRRLQAEPSLLLQQAALLHDSGKQGAKFSVVDRSVAVFLKAAAPRLLDLLTRARPGFGTRLRIYERHASIGADRLRRLGATDLAEIVAEHHDGAPRRDDTRRLQEADRRH